jgi:hypothetical protein
MKFVNFFIFLWVMLPSWIRPKSMRIHVDPDPQHWLTASTEPHNIMALAYRIDTISQGPKNFQFPGPNPLPLTLEMDALKALRTGPYKS